MVKVQTKQGVYGRVRVIEGYKDFGRLYVTKTNLSSYVVCTSERQDIATMVLINENYHFRTLKQLNIELNI